MSINSMSPGKCFLFILLLGQNFHAGEAQQASDAGCACKSRCDTSWLHSGGPWCYVDEQCKSVGWDSCPDSQMLYMSALKQKSEEAHELADANAAGTALKMQLTEATMLRKAAESSQTSLKRQLAEASAREVAALKRAEKAEHEADHFQDKNRKNLLAKIQDQEMKMKAEEEAEKKAEDAERQAEAAELQAEAKIKEMEEQLLDAKEVEREDSITIKAMQNQIMDAQALKKKAEDKAADTEVKSKQSAEADALKTAAQTKGAEKKALEEQSKATAKLSASDAKLRQSQKDLKETLRQHNADLVKESDMENKLAKQVQEGKDAEAAMLKFKAAAKVELAQALEKAAQAEKDAEKKLEEKELKRKDVEKKLKDAEAIHAEAQDKLQEKLHRQEQETHAARLDAHLYKIFKNANSKTKPVLRGLKSH